MSIASRVVCHTSRIDVARRRDDASFRSAGAPVRFTGRVHRSKPFPYFCETRRRGGRGHIRRSDRREDEPRRRRTPHARQRRFRDALDTHDGVRSTHRRCDGPARPVAPRRGRTVAPRAAARPDADVAETPIAPARDADRADALALAASAAVLLRRPRSRAPRG